jgi:ribosomal protein S18 acetylase RimI-like enzyme
MVTVELADTGHANGICRVGTASWRDAYTDVLSEAYVDANVRLRYDPERIAAQITGDSDAADVGMWLVALDDGTTAKAAGASGRGGSTAARSVVGTVRDDRPEPDVGEVSGLYVHPDWQDTGIGTRLLDALTDRHRAAGVGEQHTYVFAPNDAAIGFYESHGFEADDRFAAATVDGVAPGCEAVRYVRDL